MTRVLVVDDEPQIRRFLRIGLTAQAYEVIEADTAAAALQRVVLDSPDLVILDLGLPDQDGQSLLKELRGIYSGPVLVLSVRDQERDKVAALDSGANDYVVKPFGIQELLARLRALLRTSSGVEPPLANYNDGNLEIDFVDHSAMLDGESLRLTRKELALLSLLVRAQGRLVTQKQILVELWGSHHAGDTHYLRILVARLRAKLKDQPGAPRYIETEPGVGYRFLSSS